MEHVIFTLFFGARKPWFFSLITFRVKSRRWVSCDCFEMRHLCLGREKLVKKQSFSEEKVMFWWNRSLFTLSVNFFVWNKSTHVVSWLNRTKIPIALSTQKWRLFWLAKSRVADKITLSHSLANQKRTKFVESTNRNYQILLLIKSLATIDRFSINCWFGKKPNCCDCSWP